MEVTAILPSGDATGGPAPALRAPDPRTAGVYV